MTGSIEQDETFQTDEILFCLTKAMMKADSISLEKNYRGCFQNIFNLIYRGLSLLRELGLENLMCHYADVESIFFGQSKLNFQ
jgi:hypothetical protein